MEPPPPQQPQGLQAPQNPQDYQDLTDLTRVTYPMTNDQWYDRYDALNDAMNKAQSQASTAFLRWSRHALNPLPVSANVDRLQIAFHIHMENAPDDEPEDEDHAQVVAERFAQAHVDSMGQTTGYALPLRHSQARQYHDWLMADDQLMLDESNGTARYMANQQTPRVAPTEADARNRMAAVLLAYFEANPDEEFDADEADRHSLVTEVAGKEAGGSSETTESDRGSQVTDVVEENPGNDGEDAAEPVERTKTPQLPQEDTDNGEDAQDPEAVEAAKILLMMRGRKEYSNDDDSGEGEELVERARGTKRRRSRASDDFRHNFSGDGCAGPSGDKTNQPVETGCVGVALPTRQPQDKTNTPKTGHRKSKIRISKLDNAKKRKTKHSGPESAVSMEDLPEPMGLEKKIITHDTQPEPAVQLLPANLTVPRPNVIPYGRFSDEPSTKEFQKADGRSKTTTLGRRKRLVLGSNATSRPSGLAGGLPASKKTVWLGQDSYDRMVAANPDFLAAHVAMRERLKRETDQAISPLSSPRSMSPVRRAANTEVEQRLSIAEQRVLELPAILERLREERSKLSSEVSAAAVSLQKIDALTAVVAAPIPPFVVPPEMRGNPLLEQLALQSGLDIEKRRASAPRVVDESLVKDAVEAHMAPSPARYLGIEVTAVMPE